MDTLNLIFDPHKIKSTCLLCFQPSEDVMSVHQELFLCDEFHSIDITLAGIMNYLFPSHDILFGQVCTSCSNTLIKMYLILQKHKRARDALNAITDSLNKQVNHVHVNDNTDRLFVKIKLKSIDELPQLIEHEDCNDPQSYLQIYEYCKKCDMKFLDKDHLVRHVKISHTNINNGVICEYCGKDCKTPTKLKVHVNSHKYKTCPYCFRKLKQHAHYRTHIKRHEGVLKKSNVRKSQYNCNYCSFKSLNKLSLEAHINKTHLNTRPYICKICNKGFYKKSNLTEHKIVHNVKNLTCEQCGDSFVTKKTLVEHKRLHTGEKPFQCEICSLTFVTSGRRMEHFKRKHMEKTICCFMCDKKFSLKRQLYSHVKKVHNQSVELADLNNVIRQPYMESRDEMLPCGINPL